MFTLCMGIKLREPNNSTHTKTQKKTNNNTGGTGNIRLRADLSNLERPSGFGASQPCSAFSLAILSHCIEVVLYRYKPG